MGRPEEPPDPLVGPLAEFAVGLQALRRAVGDPSFEALGRRSDYSASDVAAAVSGRVVPSFAMTLAFVRACGGDEEEWAWRWHSLQERLGDEAERAAAHYEAGTQAGADYRAGDYRAGDYLAADYRAAERRAEPGSAAPPEHGWLNVTPADEWLAMASSLPSGEPLPPDEPLTFGGPSPPGQPRPPGHPMPDDPAHRPDPAVALGAEPAAARGAEPPRRTGCEPAAALRAEPAAEPAAELGAERPGALRAEPAPEPAPEPVARSAQESADAGDSVPDPVIEPAVEPGGHRPGQPAAESVFAPGVTAPVPAPAATLWDARAQAGARPGAAADAGQVTKPHPALAEPKEAALPPVRWWAGPPTGVTGEPAELQAGQPAGPGAANPGMSGSAVAPARGVSDAWRVAEPWAADAGPVAEPWAADAGPVAEPWAADAGRVAEPWAGAPGRRDAAPPRGAPLVDPLAEPWAAAGRGPASPPDPADPHRWREQQAAARSGLPPPSPSLRRPLEESGRPPKPTRPWDVPPSPWQRAAGGGPARPGQRGRSHERGGRGPRHRLPVLVGVLTTLAVAGIGLVYLAVFRPGHSGQPVRSAHAALASASPTPQHATPSPLRTSTGATPAVAKFPALAGVGCRAPQGTSVVMGTRSPGGDGWIRVGGGLPACGGRAIATRKSGTMGLVEDTFTWTFHTGHPATCTAKIFVADTNPSSGFAHYEVYGESLAAGTSIGQFEIDQGTAKGQWIQEGPWKVQNMLNVQLADAPAFPGDTYHVTASAALGECS